MHIEKDKPIDPFNKDTFQLAAGEATCGFLDNETIAENEPSYTELEAEFQAEVQQKSLELIKPGAKCYPYGVTVHNKTQFVFFNIFEALQNLPEEVQQEVQDLWLKALENSDISQYKLSRVRVFKKLDQAIREYWASEAELEAEIQVETANEDLI